jgi:hypothetical protein
MNEKIIPTFNDILKFKNEVCTYQQLKKSITTFIKNTKMNSDFDIVYATDREEKYQGFSFVWIENPQVFQLLLGNNPDGSTRVIKQKNPNCEKKNAEFDKLSALSDDWVYWDTLEYELEEKYGPDYLEIQDDPLVELPTFIMTQEQKIKTGSKTGIGKFEIQDVIIRLPDNNRIHYMLFAQRVPVSLSLETIRSRISKIADCQIKEIFRGSNRCVQLRFKKTSIDTQKVFLMHRKRYFGDNLLILNYQFKFSKK